MPSYHDHLLSQGSILNISLHSLTWRSLVALSLCTTTILASIATTEACAEYSHVPQTMLNWLHPDMANANDALATPDWCQDHAAQGGMLCISPARVMSDTPTLLVWAKDGDVSAQVMLGVIAANMSDYNEATYWMRSAAAKGSRYAMVHLGEMYQFGPAELQDFARAYMWITLADPTQKKLKHYRDELAAFMSDEQLRYANELVEYCDKTGLQDCE